MTSSKIQQSVLIEHPYQQQNETTTTKWNNYNTMKQLQQNETTTTKWNNYNKMKQLQQNETTATKWNNYNKKTDFLFYIHRDLWNILYLDIF